MSLKERLSDKKNVRRQFLMDGSANEMRTPLTTMNGHARMALEIQYGARVSSWPSARTHF